MTWNPGSYGHRALAAVALAAIATLALVQGALPAAAASCSYALSSTSYSGTEGSNIQIGITRTGSSCADQTVYVTYAGVTAVPGLDYTTPVPVAVSFPAASGGSATTSLTTLVNPGSGQSRTLLATITGLGSNNGDVFSSSPSTVTILEAGSSASTVQFGSAAYTANESDGTASLVVTRSGSLGAATVLCSTTYGGSATAGVDYVSVGSQLLSWAAGDSTSRACTIPLVDDGIGEASETVSVALSSPSGAALGYPSTATLTIYDSGGAAGVVQFSQWSYTVTESAGAATITIVRPGGGVGGAGVTCSTVAGGSATAGVDYVSTSQFVSFAAGQTTAYCTVQVLNDFVADGAETVQLLLSGPVNATVGSPASATLTISDSGTGAASIYSVIPSYGPTTGGTLVTITGYNLSGATSVYFGSSPCFIYGASSATQIYCTTTAHLAGTVDVYVTVAAGTASLGSAFTYTTTTGLPTVSGVSPGTGPTSGGTYVTITGTGLANVLAVQFGGVDAAIISNPDSYTVLVIAPAHVAGTVYITVTTEVGTSSATYLAAYTYTGTGIPAVTGLSPASGVPGTVITVYGSGFTGATAVTFGGVSSAFTIVSDTQITATVPAGTPVGTVDVRVATSLGTSSVVTADAFTNTATGTTSYTLYFRWTLIAWNGADNMSIASALAGQESPDNAATNNVSGSVIAIWYFDPVTQSYRGWFAAGSGIPGAVDFTTFRKGAIYWVVTSGPGTVSWTIANG